MQNLIYLIIMALAGGAGWYVGSWKGRDAVEAVARYQKVGEDAQAALAQAKTQLATDLASKDAKFDAELKKLAESHAQQLQGYDAKVAGNQAEIARLAKVSSAGQARIAELTRLRDAATTPQQRAALDTQLKDAVAQNTVVTVELDGRNCMAVQVPKDFLSDWKIAGLEVKP